MWNSASRKQYENFRRVVRLSKCTDASNELARGYSPSYAGVLTKAGFTSAAAITALPLTSFVSRVQDGIPAKDAAAIYDYASNTYESRTITSYEAVQGTGLAAIEGSISTRERLEMVKQTGETLADFGLERLFGDIDRDVCDDCNSFTSPAAYFVEILQFLRSNSSFKYSGQERIFGTALECLLARRPDLAKLELTCTNTKTVLPYLDLANEIMESFVVYLWEHSLSEKITKQAKIHAYKNPSPICGDLLSEPQEINDTAYSILSETICPFNKLPYHQPLDEIRTFLIHLKTCRYELLDSCRRAFQSGTIIAPEEETASSPELYVAAQDRAITAEYLCLTEADYIALTGEDYLQNKYNPIGVIESIQDGKPARPVRQKAWWEYWGYRKKDEALQPDTGPEVIKTEFLRRTGMQPSELVDLLKTRFVNPYVPRGKGLAILESNRFGFVSLRELLSRGVGIEDPVMKYQSLINYMDAQQDRSTSISRTGEFTREQIEGWVRANFSIFSKMIVLDNPQMSQGWHSGHARLTHLDGQRLDPSEFMRIQQFLRLRAKMGWTIGDLDMAISALSQPKAEEAQPGTPTTPSMITVDLLDQLVCVAKLLDMTGLELPKLLVFWSAISTRGENCLFNRLFLSHSHFVIDPLFKPDEDGNYFTESCKLSAHKTVIMASLGLTKDGLDAFMNAELCSEDTLVDKDLSIENLSFLYRHSLMSRALHITPTTLCQVIEVFGDIFKSPSCTLEFLEHWGHMGDVGISFAQLNYVVKGIDDQLNPLGPSKLKILAVIKSLLNGIDFIYTMHPLIRDEEHDAITKDALTAKVSLLYTDAQVKQIHKFLESAPEWVEEKSPNWLELTFSFINNDEREILFSTESSFTNKRFCFLKSFLPYLRQQLIERLVIDIMSREVGIPTEMVRALLSDILRVKVEGGGEVAALKAIGNIRLWSKNEDKANFEGYLVPPSNDIYTFVNPPSTTTTLQIDDLCVPFSNQTLSTTDPICLDGGRPYPFRATKDTNHSLQWKKNPSPIHSIPEMLLLPRYTEQKITPIFIQLAKIAIIVSSCNLSTDEVKYMASHPQNHPILNGGILSFEGWGQLLSYLRLRNSLPKVPSQELIHLFRWASNPENNKLHPEEKTLSERIAGLMFVKEDTIKRLLAHFRWDERGSFIDWGKLAKLKKACDLAQKVAIDVDSLFTWAEALGDFGQVRKVAQGIHGSVRARYTTKDWEEVVKPLRHHLRCSQRNALAGYLLNQPEVVKWGVVDIDSLFGFFLIDVQMGPCIETSRIKQAISTVQLFIQRCMSGQEEIYGVPIRTLDRKRWEWMKNYRTWEANRKILLYPENWVEPSLRDDKSPIFQEFETDILQKDCDTRSIQDAVKRYLSRVDEVANLHVISVCSDTETKVVHIFARTRGAPYFYYYRAYDPIKGTWKPWEKMQVDIPHYEDNDTNSANHGGTFLKPVVWMGRLIVFIPRFIKQAGGEEGSELESMGGLREKSLTQPTQYEHWELKVGWTEYQNGKWTPKQLTSKAFRTESGPGGAGTLRECVFTTTFCNDDLYLTAQVEKRRTAWFRLSRGQFDAVEATDLLLHEYVVAVPCINSSKPGIHREFGTIVDKDNICVSTVDPSISNAHPCPSNVHHQCLGNVDIPPSTVDYNRRNPTTSVFSALPDYTTPFYHEFSGHLLRHTSTSSTLADLYKCFCSEVSRFKHNALGYSGAPPGLDGMTYPNYHELKSPYALYNWELGLHIPMLLMDKLRSCHQYEQALEVAHYVFDPMSHHSSEMGNDYCSKDDGGHSEIDYPKKSCVWKWTPFKEISAQNVLGRLLNGLKASAPDKAGGQINGLRDAPIQPHVIARSRPVAYMKWFVMSYINILIDCGDKYFRQNTSDSVSLAIQYYTLAAHLYGPPRQKTHRRGKKNPETYESLVRKLNVVSDAAVNCKTTSPFSHKTATIATAGSTTASSFLGEVSVYFSVPENEKLRDLRAKIDDRLYKIRHCQDIRGNMCKLDLLTPQIDTVALVQTAAQGLSLYNILQGLNAPMPNYRFRYILGKAFEIVQELKSLGNAFLKAMVNKDTESYNLIRAGHETSINAMILGMKRLSLEEANKALVSLQEARKGPVCRLQHLYKLMGENETRPPLEKEYFQELTGPAAGTKHGSGYRLTTFEMAEIDKADEAAGYIEKRNTAETSSAMLLALPVMSTSAMPLGMGSLKLGQASSAYSRAMAAQMDLVQSQSIGAARKSTLLRQYQDRVQQANLTGYEIKHIDKQIEAQKIRIKIANRDIEVQQRRLDFAANTDKFLRAKYTNEDLYIWREKQLRDLYYQTYLLAYDLAKKAENSFQFERGPVNSFHFERNPSITNCIQETWDVNKDGLFCGEGLYLGLKRLEAAYNENTGYDYEITKHISLKQLNPRALLEFRELGNCEFDLPEVYFDMDFPGHYKRRIKSISLTISQRQPIGINCTMRLVRHSYRVKVPIDEDSYAGGWVNQADNSFHTDIIPIDHIATASPQKDNGMFRLTPEDGRYVPFEGAGAISRWRLELPPHFRVFDYRAITDVIVHLQYTSVYGGDTLKRIASDHVDSYMREIKSSKGGMFAFFDVKLGYPVAWEAFGSNSSLTMPGLGDNLPFFANKYSNKVTVNEILLFTSSKIDATRWRMVVPSGKGASTQEVKFNVSSARGLNCFSSGNIDCAFGTWTLELAKLAKDDSPLRDLWMVKHESFPVSVLYINIPLFFSFFTGLEVVYRWVVSVVFLFFFACTGRLSSGGAFSLLLLFSFPDITGRRMRSISYNPRFFSSPIANGPLFFLAWSTILTPITVGPQSS